MYDAQGCGGVSKATRIWSKELDPLKQVGISLTMKSSTGENSKAM